MPLTEQGKQVALAGLADRRANRPMKIRNDQLSAGAPMYFYCDSCGHVSDVLPEDYLGVPSHICKECAALKNLGWLDA